MLLVLGASALMFVLEIAGDDVRAALRLDRAAISQGEFWRLITGHMVHLGWKHTLLNVASVWLVALLFLGTYTARQWAIIMLAGAISIDAGLLLFDDLHWYVGFSGLVYSAVAAGAVRWIHDGYSDGWLLAGLLVAKIIYEQTIGPLPHSEISAGGPVSVDSHLYGIIGGTVAAIGCITAERRPSRL